MVAYADKFLEDHQAAQSVPSVLLNEGRDMIPRLEELFSKMEKGWENVKDKLEGADYDEFEKRVTDTRSKVKKCIEKLTQFLERFAEEEDLDEESDEEEEDDAVREDLEVDEEDHDEIFQPTETTRSG